MSEALEKEVVGAAGQNQSEIIYDSPPSGADDDLWLAHGAKILDESVPGVRGAASELIKALGMLQTVYLGILGFAKFIPENMEVYNKALFVVPIVPWVLATYYCLRAPQRRDRFDLRGPARGDEAGQQRDRDENERDEQEGQRVCGPHAEQETGERARKRTREAERNPRANQKPDHDDRHRLKDDQPEDVRGLRAERHAYANLARALRDPVREHAVDAYARQHQRHAREDDEQHEVEPTRRERA